MKLHFWGTRGNIATPSLDTIEFGANTTCVQVYLDDEYSFLIDCGTGIIEYATAGTDHGCTKFDILITHFHWDHIIGFPFFFPIHSPSTAIRIYSPFAADMLQENIAALFDGTYSPLRSIESLPAEISFHQMNEMGLALNGATVTYCRTDHSEACYAYRIEYGGLVLCYVSDHETRANDVNYRLYQFIRGADVLIHDGQFTEREYRMSRIGFGHSSIDRAIATAERVAAKNLILTHHNPVHSDDFLRLYLSRLQRARPMRVPVVLARERSNYIVSKDGFEVRNDDD